MIKLEYGFIKTELPGEWAEFSAKQMVKVISILAKHNNLVEAKLEVIYFLLPAKFKKVMRNLNEIELLELSKTYEFIAEKPAFENFVFEHIRKPWSLIRLSGPANSLSNLNVREYGTAEFYLKHYSEWISTPGMEEKAIESLNRFIACLYWPTIKGERAVPFSSTKFYAQVKEKAIWIDKLPYSLKQAIAHNFSSVRDFVFSQFDEAFSRSGAQSKRDKYGWDGVVNHIAATRHMVPDSIYNMNLLQLLVQLDTMAIIENERETK
jgi:hypothetical protein